MTSPLVYDAQMVGYPWRFKGSDVVYRNSQGFLMQLLVDSKLAPIPGMFVVPSATPTTASDILRYSRHEFSTYFLQHMERQPHALDPTDGNWHVELNMGNFPRVMVNKRYYQKVTAGTRKA